MAAIEHSETFVVPIDATTVRERVLTWFAQIPHTVTVDEPDRMEIKSGSQAKMRLLGGMFIAASSLPMRTTVTMTPDSDSNTEVTVTGTEAAGFGVKTGMKAKYEGRVGEVVTSLRSALS